MKKCYNCQIIKSFEFFHKDKTKKDGLRVICKQCVSDHSRTFYKRKKKEIIDYQKTYYVKNINKILDQRKSYYQNNKKEIFKRQKKWNNKNKETLRAIKSKYKKTDQGKVIGKISRAKRRYKELHSTPSWVNLEEIKEIYKNCPEGYHVDHVVPLQNPIVCGLHVPWNLQYLTAEENLKKGNKLIYG